jgi:hypothetical protein
MGVLAMLELDVETAALRESAEARQRNADHPDHAEALEASGMTAMVRGSRARAFEVAELTLSDDSRALSGS